MDLTLAAFTDQFGKPSRVIALGQSMGGLVTGQLAETAGDLIDGAVPTCGLMSGGVQLLNYQTDALHSLAQLITPNGGDLKLAGFDNIGEAQALVSALSAAVSEAEQSPEGRARLALAAAFLQAATWDGGQPQPKQNDYASIAQEQLSVLKSNIPFLVFARYDIEQTNGGNSSWNLGVDYSELLRHSPTMQVVQKMYRDAGLDLKGAVALLTETADLSADAGALQRSTEISGLTGRLQMPVLSIHTTYDTLVPFQIQEEYGETVRGARSQKLLRQAAVARVGHCTFTPAEYVAGVIAMDEAIEAGHWTSASTGAGLDRLAESLNLGGSEYKKGAVADEWLGDRGGIFGGSCHRPRVSKSFRTIRHRNGVGTRRWPGEFRRALFTMPRWAASKV